MKKCPSPAVLEKMKALCMLLMGNVKLSRHLKVKHFNLCEVYNLKREVKLIGGEESLIPVT